MKRTSWNHLGHYSQDCLPKMRSAPWNTCSRPCTFTRTPLVARRFRLVMNGSSPYLSITGEIATVTRCIALRDEQNFGWLFPRVKNYSSLCFLICEPRGLQTSTCQNTYLQSKSVRRNRGCSRNKNPSQIFLQTTTTHSLGKSISSKTSGSWISLSSVLSKGTYWNVSHRGTNSRLSPENLGTYSGSPTLFSSGSYEVNA